MKKVRANNKKTTLGLRGKILWGVAFSAVMTAAVAFLVASNMKDLERSQQDLFVAQEKAKHFNQIFLYLKNMEMGIRSYLISGDTELLKPFSDTEEVLGAYTDKTIELFAGEEKQIERLTKVKGLLSEWVKTAAVGEMLARRKLQVGMIDFKQFAEVFKNSKGHGIVNEINDLVSAGIEDQNKAILKNKEITTSLSRSTTLYTILGLSASILFGILFQFVITKLLHSDLKNAVDHLVNIEESINTSASGLVNTSSGMKTSSQELKSSLSTTSSSLTEISAMIGDTQRNTESSLSSAEESAESAEFGGKNVKNLVSAIGDIDKSSKTMIDEMKRSNQQITEIVDVINEISEKTKVINDIVFQTKLLSFNASVEAARAGESGKGFAVVAEEVGSLAQMSGEASSEISQILDTGVKRVNSIVDQYSSSVDKMSSLVGDKVSTGLKLAKVCDDSLQAIVKNSHSVNEMLKSIESAIAEQSTGVKTIADETNHIDLISSKSFDFAQKTAKEVDSLEHLSTDLKSTIGSISNSFLGAKSSAPKTSQKSKGPSKPKSSNKAVGKAA